MKRQSCAKTCIEKRFAFSAAVVCSLSLLFCRPASAHFLWAQLQPAPASTLTVGFSEEAGEKTLPQLLPRVHPDRAWTAGGRPLTLTSGTDNLTAPCTGSIAAAEQTWGVLDRSEEKRGIFLLRYYAKAASGLTEAEQSAHLPVEITLTHIGSPCRAVVTRGHTPAAGAEIILARPGDAPPDSLTTGRDGSFQFNLRGDGLYSIRAMVAEKKSGKYGGKAYKLVRNYTTLTFPVRGKADAPAMATAPVSADPAAYALLKAAHDNRQVLPVDFGGVTANIAFNDNGKVCTGTLAYSKTDDVTLTMAGLSSDGREWLEEQLSNALGHRRGGDFAKGDGRNPITFTPNDGSPLGRQVTLHDGLHSFYRVKDNVVTEVTRTMGGSRFTITVLETTTADGKYLPRHFAVTYFDAATEALQSVEEFTDTYASTGGNWLPVSRRVIKAEKGAQTVREFTLSNIKLAPAN